MNTHARQLFVDGFRDIPRSAQTVHVSTSSYGGKTIFGTRCGPRHVVHVTPEGSDIGLYYECSDRTLALLREGMTPDDLELDPLTPEECAAVDNSTYWGED